MKPTATKFPPPVCHATSHIIHPIHRFKSSDWLRGGHMTWIIFNNVNVWKLIHVCYSKYYFPNSQRSCHSCRLWNSIAYFPDFTVSTDWKNLMNWVYKTNTDCCRSGNCRKIIVPWVQFNLGLLFTYGPWWTSLSVSHDGPGAKITGKMAPGPYILKRTGSCFFRTRSQSQNSSGGGECNCNFKLFLNILFLLI